MSTPASSRPTIKQATAVVMAAAVLAAGWLWLEPGTMSGTETSAEKQVIMADLRLLKEATLRYAKAEHRLPDSLHALVPAYLPQLPRDPWGHEYVLRSGGPDRVFIWCLGSDGELRRYPPDILAVVNREASLEPPSRTE